LHALIKRYWKVHFLNPIQIGRLFHGRRSKIEL
jgi:hypothetical protein